MATAFSDVLASLAEDGDGFAIDLTEDWRQGRTAYGGVSAALCYEAAKRKFGLQGMLRSAQIAYIGPASGRLTLAPTLLRQGKSTTFAAVDLAGESGLAVRALFVFGAPRPSALDLQRLPAPTAPPPDAVDPFFRGGVGPAFAQHFEVRLVRGSRPVSGAAEADILLWARHRDAGARGMAALLALADAPPPAAMTMFRAPAPISTMTWMVDVIDAGPETTDGWWLLRSTAETAKEGYSAQAMTLWSASGTPVFIGRQSVAVFG